MNGWQPERFQVVGVFENTDRLGMRLSHHWRAFWRTEYPGYFALCRNVGLPDLLAQLELVHVWEEVCLVQDLGAANDLRLSVIWIERSIQPG
jgi:hypothetical protein